jgi:hypothetical protein
MTRSTGVAKQLRYKKETTWGTAAGQASGKLLRRLNSDLNLTKNTYESKEIRPEQQLADFRHGTRGVDGKISGELSVGTWIDFMSSALRQAMQTAATTGALTTVTAATTTGTAGTFTRSSGSYFTDGFKVGDVVRWTGWATTGVNNNSKNMMITDLTATVMTVTTLDGTAVAAKAAGDSVTGLVQGKKTFVPTTGATDESYSIEHWFSDISQSELFTGCKISQVDVNMPSTGMGEITFTFMGKDLANSTGRGGVATTTMYFTSPTAASTGNSLSAVNGAVIVGGTQVSNVTGINFTISGNMTTGEVIGSNTRPDIFKGMIKVTGQITSYFEDATYRDMFDQETEGSVIVAMTGDNTAAASFVSFVMTRAKLGGNSKDDGDKGLIQTIPFTALLQTAGGTGTKYDNTTISFQDSSA